MAEREITITLRGQNLTQEGFDAARRGLLGLDDSAGRTKQSTDSLGSSWTRLTSSFVAAGLIERGAAALLQFGRQALEVTGDLADLHGTTGMSVEALQRLAYVTSQSGVPLEKLADGAVKMGRALVQGDKSAVAAVNALGLSVETLIAAGPEQAFLEIGEAIAKVPNPMEQAALAVALFGRSGADFLPAFTENMTELAQQAQESGAILDSDLVAAGDAAGDALGRLSLVGQAVIGKVLIPMMPAIEAVANWMGRALPAALDAARAGVDFLLRQGFELRAWLYDLAVSVSETVRDVPVLGRVFGQSAADVDELKRNAQYARDALNSFNAQGVRPATETVRTAIPIVTDFGEAVASTGRKARQAKEDHSIVWGEIGNIVRMQIAGVLNPSLTDFETQTDNATEAVQDLRDELQRLAGEAIQIGPVLASSMTMPWVEFRGTVEDTGTATDGFFAQVFGGAESLGTSISSIFSEAFVGGGGALGAVKAFATQTLSSLLGMIPGIGQFAAAFAGPIVEMLSKLIGKAKDWWRELFGGPSRAELHDRNLVREWEDQVLTAYASAATGATRWEQVLNAANAALGAQGYTAEEIRIIIERLWASSQEGGEETWRVVDELNRMLQQRARDTETAIDRVGDALADLPDEINIDIIGHYRAPDIPDGSRYGSSFGARFGAADVARAAALSGPMPAASGPINLYIGVDPKAGTVRVLGDGERRQVQTWLSTGQLMIPARAVGMR